MFPTRLNFLSSQKRNYLDSLLYMQFTKNTLEVGLIVLSIATLILVGGWWILQGYFTNLVTQAALIATHQSRRNTEIKEVNATIHFLEQTQKNYTLWTPILEDIVNHIPSGITLATMDLNAPNKSYLLGGVADTRDDLLGLRDALQTITGVKEVVIPLSQLTAKEHLTFSLTVTVN